MSAATRLCALLAIAVAIWFLPSLPFEITNWDDDFYIEMNPFIRNPANARHAFAETYFGNYQPLVHVSYAIDYFIGGVSPAVFRVQNIAWHIGCAVLLALLLQRLSGNSEWSFLLALAWAIHPMRNESVVWLSERKDVLSGFFMLAALLLRTRALPDRRGNAALAQAAECTLLILALLAKASAIVYAPLALAYDALLRRDALRARAPWIGMQFALCIAFAWIGIVAAKGDPLPPEYATLAARIQGALFSPGDSLLRTILPFGLSPLHPRAFAPEAASFRFVVSAAITLAACACVPALARRRPEAAFGLSFFLVAIAPVSGLVPDGAHFVADRYAYLPAMGLTIAFGALITNVGEKWRPWLAGAALLPIAFSNPPRHMAVWRSTETLWASVLEAYPTFDTAKIKLAQERLERGGHADSGAIAAVQGDFAASLREEVLQRSLLREGRLDDAATQMTAMAEGPAKWRGLMLLHAKRGDVGETVRASQALLASPDATRDDPGLAAIALTEAGALGEAESVIEHHKTRLSIVMARAQGSLARKLAARGDYDAARDAVRDSLAVNPEDPEAILAIAEIGRATNEAHAARASLMRIARRPGLPGDARDALVSALVLLDRSSAPPR